MEYALVGLLAIFLVFLYIETKRKAGRVASAVLEEKRSIAEDSGMTASIGVFSPDIQTTVVIGASEHLGVFYYRMLRQARVIIRSRINLANLARVDFLLDGNPYQIELNSGLPTLSLRATEIADAVISKFSPEAIRQIRRAALRVGFYDETGLEKTLEITTLRAGEERQRFERVPLLKNTVWWTAFLQIASRDARHARAKLESPEDAPTGA